MPQKWHDVHDDDDAHGHERTYHPVMVASPHPDLARADFSRIEPRAVALLAERWARRHRVIPLAVDRDTITVATSDPLDFDAERSITFATGHRVRWEVAMADDIAQYLDRVYPDASSRRDPAAPPIEVQHLPFSTDTGGTDQADDAGASVIRLTADGPMRRRSIRLLNAGLYCGIALPTCAPQGRCSVDRIKLLRPCDIYPDTGGWQDKTIRGYKKANAVVAAVE